MVSGNEDLKKIIKKFESTIKIFWKGQYAEALSAFEQLRNHSLLDFTLADRIQTHVEVCKLRLGIDEIKPKAAEELYLAGVINLNRGKFEEGIAYLSQATGKDKGNDAYIYSLACAYARNKQHEEALENLNKAIAINPDNKIYASNCDDFSFLHEDENMSDLLSAD